MEETTQSQPEQNVEEVVENTTKDQAEGAEKEALEDGLEQEVENVGEKEVEDSSTLEGEQADDFYLDVKYNKETKSLSREDAIRYAQKGMKMESIEPALSKLRYLASVDGKNLNDFVQSILDGIENEKREEFAKKADGDEEILQALIEADKLKNQKAYDEILNAEKNAQEQDEKDEIKILADEFTQLQREVPEILNFEDVPQEVIKIREHNSVSLFDAYLRFERAQKRESALAQANAQNSTGSIRGENANARPQWEKNLLSGIWG